MPTIIDSFVGIKGSVAETNIEHLRKFVVARGCVPVAQGEGEQGELFFLWDIFGCRAMKDLVVTQFVQRRGEESKVCEVSCACIFKRVYFFCVVLSKKNEAACCEGLIRSICSY